MRPVYSLVLVVVMIAAAATATTTDTAAKAVRRIGAPVRKQTVSVSGLSAGAFFAVQAHVALSSTVRAALVVAGGPYRCSGGSFTGALNCAMHANMNLTALVAETKAASARGDIDDVRNVQHQLLYLYSGTKDTVVMPATMRQLQAYYQDLGVPSNNIRTQFDVPSVHGWITDRYGGPCATMSSIGINNCGVDVGGLFLAWAVPQLDASSPWNGSRAAYNASALYTFDQSRYGADASSNSLAKQGFVYVPEACLRPGHPCHLHINFHGTFQDSARLGVRYVSQTELNGWALANDIVIVYPQVAFSLLCMTGAFDWWGYTGADYAGKQAKQMAVVKRIIDGLLNGSFEFNNIN